MAQQGDGYTLRERNSTSYKQRTFTLLQEQLAIVGGLFCSLKDGLQPIAILLLRQVLDSFMVGGSLDRTVHEMRNAAGEVERVVLALTVLPADMPQEIHIILLAGCL
jgi:hypothetical protein